MPQIISLVHSRRSPNVLAVLSGGRLLCRLTVNYVNLKFLLHNSIAIALNIFIATYIFRRERRVSHIQLMGDASLAALNVTDLI